MTSYDALAGRYDTLTADVDYAAWADYIQRHLRRCPIPVSTVLDLACGTGTLTCLLAQRGYEMIGADRSAEMLAAAAEKAQGLGAAAPIFLHQSMEKLDLYGTVDACICCLDSVNYVTRADRLQRAFARVHLFLQPGGLFLFDVRTPDSLRALDGGTFVDEGEDTYCLWRADWSERRKICTYGMDLFLRQPGGLWRREEELHEQRAYEADELEAMLRRAGFSQVRRHGTLKLRPPKDGEARIFFSARKD